MNVQPCSYISAVDFGGSAVPLLNGNAYIVPVYDVVTLDIVELSGNKPYQRISHDTYNNKYTITDVKAGVNMVSWTKAKRSSISRTTPRTAKTDLSTLFAHSVPRWI